MPRKNLIEVPCHALEQEGGTAVPAVKDGGAAVRFGGAYAKGHRFEHGRDAGAPLFVDFSFGSLFARS